MNVNLERYAGKKVCVAVSGGKDSMALLHYMAAHCGQYKITLTALNCDHRMRAETSARDSAFVAAYCQREGITLFTYVADGMNFSGESAARLWRIGCYAEAARKNNLDCVATAHHLNDNAETVLFNLARGSALRGMTGIGDEDISALAGKACTIVRPFIACTREEIDAYAAENNIPYVEDETNSTDNYTRNRIRHNVLPALETAVPGAAGAIYRFSRLAAEDEEYLSRKAAELITLRPVGYAIAHCAEKVLFRRAAVSVIAAPSAYRRKDYTSDQLNRLYDLQFADNGKQFRFLGLTALKENGGITIADDSEVSLNGKEIPYLDYCVNFSRYLGKFAAIHIGTKPDTNSIFIQENYAKLGKNGYLVDDIKQENFTIPALKILTYDNDKVPASAVVRFFEAGDKFTKFGGGTKSLGDYFTDRKIPRSCRKTIPLICNGNDVLLIFGVEISDKVKTDTGTKNTAYAVAVDYCALK